MQPDFDPNVIYIAPYLACRALDVSPMQLKHMVWAKQLESVLVGGRVMLYRADVEALAEKKFAVPQQPDPIEARKKLEASYGVPANQQFTVPSV